MSNQHQISIHGSSAVPIRNEKGELSMKKVKVHRYISGKRPDYAQHHSSDDESDTDNFVDRRAQRNFANRGEDRHNDSNENETGTTDDARLRRLMQVKRKDSDSAEDSDDDRDSRLRRHRRHVHEPEIIQEDDEEEEMESDVEMVEPSEPVELERKRRIELGSDSSESELSDTEVDNRRQRLRQKVLQQQRKEEEVLVKEEEKQSESSGSDETTESEETESEEEENQPRLKPLFVSKRDRATIAEKEKEIQKQKQMEHEAKRMAKERRRQTLRMVEESVKKDLEKTKPDSNEANINDVCTDDENDDVEYEAWKLRELRRIKRDREEKDQVEKERVEIERLRNLTEEERRQELRQNPREVTNKASKGKYKYLQKFYHRGAFFLDKDEDLFKRDFAQATLEDHFDKTILPKVMQVKNFGRCGRTKYTHLVDQDTTQFDSPWYSETTSNTKFHTEKGGGMKQVFDKPSASKRKK